MKLHVDTLRMIVNMNKPEDVVNLLLELLTESIENEAMVLDMFGDGACAGRYAEAKALRAFISERGVR